MSLLAGALAAMLAAASGRCGAAELAARAPAVPAVPAIAASPGLAPAPAAPLAASGIPSGIPPAAAPLPPSALAPSQAAAPVPAQAEAQAKAQASSSAKTAAPRLSAEKRAALDGLVRGRAGAEFTRAVRARMAASIPPAILRDLARGGYRVEINKTIRQGRESLHEDNDYTGGFHSYGPAGKLIIIAQKIKHLASGEWRDNKVWENGITHEIGHAVAYLMGERAAEVAQASGDAAQAEWYRTKGISESPAFRAAWRADFEAVPADLKSATLDGGKRNDLYYFLHPDDNGWFQRARQETFAEAFDILLRGPASTFNYENFQKHFPRALAEARRIVEAEYGPLP